MNCGHSLSVSWARRAIEIACSQGALANSPSEPNVGHRPTLCAASCVAYAGFIELDSGQAESFLHALSSFPTKVDVVKAYEQLGLSRDLATATMALNDLTPRE